VSRGRVAGWMFANESRASVKPLVLQFLGALLLLGAACADEPAHRARIVAIQVANQQTPEYQVSGPRDKSTKPRNWIEIEAEIEVETTDPSGFIPDLEAKWFAVVIDRHTKKPVRLRGESRYKNINTKDGKVFVSAYIEPDTLERLTGRSKPRDSDIEGYALVLSGSGIVRAGKYAADLVKATAEEKSEWWSQWTQTTLDNMIVPKSRTPFAPLWTDRYPTEDIRR